MSGVWDGWRKEAGDWWKEVDIGVGELCIWDSIMNHFGNHSTPIKKTYYSQIIPTNKFISMIAIIYLIIFK